MAIGYEPDYSIFDIRTDYAPHPFLSKTKWFLIQYLQAPWQGSVYWVSLPFLKLVPVGIKMFAIGLSGDLKKK